MECLKPITIINKLGLHARAAAKLVALASHYQSQIFLKRMKDGAEQIADCKSIMSVMMLAAGQGTTLELMIKGDDAQAALASIEALINNRFEELE